MDAILLTVPPLTATLAVVGSRTADLSLLLTVILAYLLSSLCTGIALAMYFRFASSIASEREQPWHSGVLAGFFWLILIFVPIGDLYTRIRHGAK